MSTGDRIRQARISKGYTQEYLAEKLQVSRQAVSKWEKGATNPDTHNLIALAGLLDTSVEFLATGQIPEPPMAPVRHGRAFYLSSLIPIAIIFICGFIGLVSGEYTDMVTIPIDRGTRIGIPFLCYGDSPAAIVLLTISALCLILAAVLLFLGWIHDHKMKNTSTGVAGGCHLGV